MIDCALITIDPAVRVAASVSGEYLGSNVVACDDGTYESD